MYHLLVGFALKATFVVQAWLLTRHPATMLIQSALANLTVGRVILTLGVLVSLVVGTSNSVYIYIYNIYYKN